MNCGFFHLLKNHTKQLFSSKFQCRKYQNVSDSCTGFPDFVGDGFCDDQNNTPFCFFDGGDCCFNVTTDFCSECNCFQGTICIDGKNLQINLGT